MKLLLSAGVPINMQNRSGMNALEYVVWKKLNVSNDVVMLLFAAGERVSAPLLHQLTEREDGNSARLVLCLNGLVTNNGELRLEHLCRQAIRSHLMFVDRHQNLFCRIPQLRNSVPEAMKEYLLFDLSVDTRRDEEVRQQQTEEYVESDESDDEGGWTSWGLTGIVDDESDEQ